MASILRIKRSELVGNPGTLAAGELAYSAADPGTTAGGGRLYIGTGTETNFDAANHVVIGGKYFTDMLDAATASGTNGTLVKRNSSGTATLNIIGNVTGNVTGNVSTTTQWLTPRNLSLTGDATATLANVDGSAAVSAAITLATVNSNVGTYGAAATIPVITVNEKGLVTAVTTASVATSLNVVGTTGNTGSMNLLTDTLSISGSGGITSSFNDSTKTLSLSLSGTGTLTALTVNTSLSSNTISVFGESSFGNTTTNNLSVGGNAVITGNLTVNGTMTAVNSNTVTIQDLNINVASNANTAINANGGGITVGVTLDSFTAATLNYTALDNRWNFNKDLNVANVYGALKGNADTASAWVAGRNLSLTGDASATLASVDGSQNVSATLTLANVNSNTGSFGDSVTVPTFTVNAKGLITSASTAAIPYASTSVKGLASFDSTQFSIASGAVTLSTVDGGSY